jgi:hypothetical protein
VEEEGETMKKADGSLVVLQPAQVMRWHSDDAYRATVTASAERLCNRERHDVAVVAADGTVMALLRWSPIAPN